MSSCMCVACGYEVIVPCCRDRPIYYGYCRPCITRISWANVSCFSCHSSIDAEIYRIQRELSFSNTQLPPASSLHPRAQTFSRHHYSLPQPQNCRSTNPSSQLRNEQLPLQTFQHLSQQVASGISSRVRAVEQEWYLTEEDVLRADAALDAPLDYEVYLEKERKKNGITVGSTIFSERPVIKKRPLKRVDTEWQVGSEMVSESLEHDSWDDMDWRKDE